MLASDKTRIILHVISYIMVGLFFVFIIKYKTCTSVAISPKDTKSAIVSAFENLYGEWEIVEDYGYHGIHRMTEIEVYEVGKVLLFQQDAFRYDGSIDVSYPRIEIEMVSSAEMQMVDRIEYPHNIGFDNQYILYAKLKLHDKDTGLIYTIYVLSDNEIILEGDVHRYYRAVKKETVL